MSKQNYRKCTGLKVVSLMILKTVTKNMNIIKNCKFAN